MTDEAHTVTTSVICPHCRAEATLIYTQVNAQPRPQHRHDMIYLCPNECVLTSRQISALIDRP